jgi:hypothetical protein
MPVTISEARIMELRKSLEEIRDVARVSEDVEWYAMVADQALKKDEATREANA